MPFKLVLLPTDLLLWLLVAAAIGYGAYCARRAHLAAPWARVFRAPAAVVSSVLLGCYLLVGLADSLHFRLRLERVSAEAQTAYSPEVLSVLDLALTRLRSSTERSYSAPLATRAFARELVELGRDVALVAEEARMVRAPGIDENEEHVGCLARGNGTRATDDDAGHEECEREGGEHAGRMTTAAEALAQGRERARAARLDVDWHRRRRAGGRRSRASRGRVALPHRRRDPNARGRR